MTASNFKPIAIGTDSRGARQAIAAWNDFATAATFFKMDIASFLETKYLPFDQFFKLPLLGKTEDLLVELVKLKGHQLPGISVEKMLSLGLIENEFMTDIYSSQEAFKNASQKANSLYKFDWKLLIDESGTFTLPPEFDAAVTQSYTQFTESDLENELMLHLQKLIDELNYFASKRITRPDRGAALGLNVLLKTIRANDTRTGFEPWLNSLAILRNFKE